MRENIILETINLEILQFAGFAFILFGLIKKAGSTLLLAGTALAMSVAGCFLRMIDTGNTLANVVIGMFEGTTGEIIQSVFPLLNWFIFVVAGYLFGKLIRRCPNMTRLFLFIAPISSAIVFGYMAYAVPRGIGMYNYDNELLFFHMNISDAAICLLSALQLISICYFIVKQLPGPVINKCKKIASNLNDIYLAQWVIIHWVVGFALKGIFNIDLTTGVTLLISTAITIASVIVGEIAGNRRKKRIKAIYAGDTKQ